MEEIKSFLISVSVVSAILGIIKLISPDCKNGSVKKQISFAAAIALSMSIAVPFIKLIKNKDIAVNFDYSYENPEVISDGAADEVINSTAEIITRELRAMIEEKYSVEELRLTVKINKEDMSNLKVEEITLGGRGELSQIKKYISEVLGCNEKNVKIEGEVSE